MVQSPAGPMRDGSRLVDGVSPLSWARRESIKDEGCVMTWKEAANQWTSSLGQLVVLLSRALYVEVMIEV